jgi:cytochrome b561
MKTIQHLFLPLCCLMISSGWSQEVDSENADDLFSMMEESQDSEELLPERMLLSQRIFWGEKGLFRKTGLAPLNMEQREKELRLRRTMLTAHQVVGYATLAGMLAQGIIGGKLYNGDTQLRDTHETLGNIVTAMYFTDAGLSLFAPPPLVNKKVKGWSSMKAHKALATIHLSAMIATQMLAEENKKAHRAAAYTAFGAYAAAAVVMKF